MPKRPKRMISLNGWLESEIKIREFGQLPELVNFTENAGHEEIEYHHDDIGRLIISSGRPALIHGEIVAEEYENFFHQLIDSLAQRHDISFQFEFFEEDGRLIRKKSG